ncbi:hypothetical protein OFC56_29655, partial [Escherichia coli]|nr:hypothetical protein [Escherichia coli]
DGLVSALSRWSYKNTATIRPFISLDLMRGQSLYGDEYEIACNWTADSKPERESGGMSGARGAEFISQHIIYTEDARPKYLDMIKLEGRDDWEEIRSVTVWDMAMFG